MGTAQTQNNETPTIGNTPGRAPATATQRRQQIVAYARGGRFGQAEEQLRTALIEFPDDAELAELAGDVAVALQQPSTAIERYRSATELRTQPSIELLDKIGRQWMQLGQPYRSVEILEQMVVLDPTSAATRRDLAGLQAALGLERRAAEHLRYLVQRNQAGVEELIILSELSRPQTDEAICNYALEHHPDDRRPAYAVARQACYDNRWAEAIGTLREVWERHPEFPEGSAYYGRAIVETATSDAKARITEWLETVTDEVKQQPQYWVALGLWSQRESRIDQAAHAYWNAVRLDENDGEALNRLASTLGQVGHPNEAALASARAQAVTAMRDHIDSLLYWRKHSQRAATQIALSMQKLGRVWEAANWAKSAVLMTQDPDADAKQVFTQIRAQLTSKTPWQQPETLVANKIDVSELPQPAWDTPQGNNTPSPTNVVVTESKLPIRFQDEAAQRGLNHACKIAAPANGDAGMWIYQSGAGGAATIDYDLDGWPDVYLTNCDGHPLQTDSSSNQLYRNVDGNFQNKTEIAWCVDHCYSQGVAVGDVNSDGFADIYVGVFGLNRLLINCGDGTFEDATESWNAGGDREWTTSVAIADLNLDAIADLFAVQYVSGDDVITRKCFPDELPQHRSCGPLVFPAQNDRVFAGRASGGYDDKSIEWLDATDPGRGLGLVVGQLDGETGLDIYVSNDMTANHFWSGQSNDAANNDPANNDSSTRFHEQGAARGLAFNARSLSQASMGIAADDADRDGDLDFYVTHFSDDYNTAYMQVHPGLWSDQTGALGLSEPTIRTLGYGTQWVDADSDGMMELLVANGHVDDFTHTGQLYRMPLQLFRQTDTKRFELVAADSVGSAFTEQRLGRAMVLADFNRDGRTDALVANLLDPVSLLINQSEQANEVIEIRLVGTHCHRDAVGAIVTLQQDAWTVVKHRLAGNGYQCSNETILRFACSGRATELGKDGIVATVRWPDGQTERKDGLRPGQQYLWIQNVELDCSTE
ncbi:FG-GAP-like repeat-containing protein [Rhodopirellula sp. MGV]|uniref:FG-GAP-like repeat-containing protein n=1 Tax=Rhodopirellula sp. MGV TaxID=2023130 RepID=UPI0013046144|nr:FG-GAP-like repeat-containing protein [Rhodopirellula sp. MGV]